MGTKQLLLIVLSVFIVGAAVLVSLEVFDTQFSGQVKDMAIQQMHDISSYAVAHWKRPVDSGGGGGSYIGFKIPSSIKEDALSWKFDTRVSNDELNFFMISKQLVYNKKPYLLQGVHKGGRLVIIKLFDPEKNIWETLIDDTGE